MSKKKKKKNSSADDLTNPAACDWATAYTKKKNCENCAQSLNRKN